MNDWAENLANRINNFWGYGSLEGDKWFIGMEEGYDSKIENLKQRIMDTGNNAVVDILNEQKKYGIEIKWFKSPNPPIQNTWKGYIIIKLYLDLGRRPTLDEIREFQLNKLGRSKIDGKANDHAILELMPLPAPSLKNKDWMYEDFGVEDFLTRKIYIEKYKPQQILKLKALIEKHKPKLVVFFSTTYFNDWQKIVPGELAKVQDRQFIYQDKNTLYCVLPHPVAHGVKNSDWDIWGKELLGRYKK